MLAVSVAAGNADVKPSEPCLAAPACNLVSAIVGDIVPLPLTTDNTDVGLAAYTSMIAVCHSSSSAFVSSLKMPDVFAGPAS